MDPLTNTPVVSFLGSGLGALRGKATGAEQTADVVGVVDDLQTFLDQLGNPLTRPPGGGKPPSLRTLKDPSNQLTPLLGSELRRSAGCWPGFQARAALLSAGSLPTSDRSSVHAQSLGHDMRRQPLFQPFQRP
jgi:hypothetical protein